MLAHRTAMRLPLQRKPFMQGRLISAILTTLSEWHSAHLSGTGKNLLDSLKSKVDMLAHGLAFTATPSADASCRSACWSESDMLPRPLDHQEQEG